MVDEGEELLESGFILDFDLEVVAFRSNPHEDVIVPVLSLETIRPLSYLVDHQILYLPTNSQYDLA